MFLISIFRLVPWFIIPVRSKPRKDYCWTGLLTPFPNKAYQTPPFQQVCHSDGSLHHLDSDSFFFVNLSPNLGHCAYWSIVPFLLRMGRDIIFISRVFNALILVSLPIMLRYCLFQLVCRHYFRLLFSISKS